MSKDNVNRCPWCGEDPLYQRYHDEEWGVPVHDHRQLFEMLCLEGQQAGLSWITVLRKRERYRQQFCNFEPAKIIKLSDVQLDKKLEDPGIIRHRLKIHAIRDNARAYFALQESTDFANFLWDFVGGEPRLNRPKTMRSVPATTAESDAMSKALKKRGFRFVGSTICYAFMQATGMVNDHIQSCWRAPK